MIVTIDVTEGDDWDNVSTDEAKSAAAPTGSPTPFPTGSPTAPTELDSPPEARCRLLQDRRPARLLQPQDLQLDRKPGAVSGPTPPTTGSPTGPQARRHLLQDRRPARLLQPQVLQLDRKLDAMFYRIADWPDSFTHRISSWTASPTPPNL